MLCTCDSDRLVTFPVIFVYYLWSTEVLHEGHHEIAYLSRLHTFTKERPLSIVVNEYWWWEVKFEADIFFNFIAKPTEPVKNS
jgi:hypothetical protein